MKNFYLCGDACDRSRAYGNGLNGSDELQSVQAHEANMITRLTSRRRGCIDKTSK